MSVAAAFADISAQFSAVFGGPYFDAMVMTPGVPVTDDGGSIVTPVASTERTCQCQVDDCTEDQRAEAGYTDKDVRLLILTATLAGGLDTEDTLTVLGGPRAGSYSVQSVSGESFGIYWQCRGRAAHGG